MHLHEYQETAAETDQYPNSTHGTDTDKSRIIPILGLVGEVGSLAAEYKKLLRDGAAHSRFHANLAEELGDILWYLADVATKAGLKLEDIAAANIEKTRDRFIKPNRSYLYDEDLPLEQRLPRAFKYRLRHEEVGGREKLVMLDLERNEALGNPLTDNAYEDDGYRYHDVMHLAFAARLGWSPVLRKLMRTKNWLVNRFSEQPQREDTEDGGRAQVIEEAIVAASYVYYSRHPGAKTIDWQLLRFIKDLTVGIEVSSRSEAEWEESLLQGFGVWDALRAGNGGTIEGDLLAGTLMYIR